MKYRGRDIINSDWIGIIAILLIVISGSLFTYYFIVKEIHSCTSDPLTYSILQKIDENYTYARVDVYYNKGDLVPIKTIEKNLKPEPIYPNLSSPF